MSKFVDENGLLYFWQGLKSRLAAKVDKVDGKGLSTNDYTDTEKTKLAGVAENANNYTHPSYTAHETGLYKVSVDSSGHIASVTDVVKADITALGIPGEAGGSYSNATSSADGLMSKEDKAALDTLVTNSSSYVTSSDLSTAISNAGHMTKQIVETLPAAASASETVIYLVLKSSGDSGNVYDEYMLVNGAMEKIGDTSTTIEALTNAEIDAIFAETIGS